MPKPTFRLIHGGLAGLDDLMAEFAANTPMETRLAIDAQDVEIPDATMSETAEKEFWDVTAPGETDEFVLKVGPFLVDLD